MHGDVHEQVDRLWNIRHLHADIPQAPRHVLGARRVRALHPELPVALGVARRDQQVVHAG
jgi:hypothetical protein